MITIMVYLFYSNCFAQTNLVPNGSFETYSSCPIGSINGLPLATPWFQPNTEGNSSDFYHACSGDVPYYANWTYQYPRTGNGYSGIELFVDTTSDMDREYIEVGLTDSLKQGKKYCVRFYTNKDNLSSWAIKNIQGVLTNDSLLYHDANYNYITGVTPIMEADSVITDTLNWIPVQTTYTAHGGEKFLTIGNFTSGVSTIYKYEWPYSSWSSLGGYYLIDDVSIYELPDVNAGNDTLIPPGDSVRLGTTGRPDIFYSWLPTTGLNNPNISNPMATPASTTVYVLTVTDTNLLACTNTYTDTVKVEVGYLGIKENSNAVNFNIYPNPATTDLHIECNLQDVLITITDVCGKEIKQLQIENKTVDVDISDLQNGIYFITAMDKNNSLKSTKRFVVLK